jgi:hypothetical protein
MFQDKLRAGVMLVTMVTVATVLCVVVARCCPASPPFHDAYHWVYLQLVWLDSIVAGSAHPRGERCSMRPTRRRDQATPVLDPNKDADTTGL